MLSIVEWSIALIGGTKAKGAKGICILAVLGTLCMVQACPTPAPSNEATNETNKEAKNEPTNESGIEPAVEPIRDTKDGSITPDAGPRESTTETTNTTDVGPVDIGPPTSFPLRKEQVQRLGPAILLDVASALWSDGKGWYALFESFNEPFSQGALHLSTSTGGTFSKPKKIPLSPQAIIASPSVITWKGQRWLYFVDTAGIQSAITIKRSKFIDGNIRNAESVGSIKGVASLLSWPKFYTWKDKVLVAFRDGQSRPSIAISNDGKTFAAPIVVEPQAGAMATLGITKEKTLLYTYQYSTNTEAMLSFFRTSNDGSSWSAPQRVSNNSTNVHDTTSIARLDGGIDMYYIYPKGNVGFALFRRSVSPSGKPGPEQQLTNESLGEPSKPEVTRLPDGRLLLGWSEISKRAPNGLPAEQTFQLVAITGDAPNR